MLEQEQIYEKQIGAAKWYVTHKVLIRRIIIIALIVFNVALFAYNVNLLLTNFWFRLSGYQADLNSYVVGDTDYSRLRQLNLPQNIQTGEIQRFENQSNADLMVEIANPNQRWWATFDYQFKLDEGVTELRSSFVLPAERKKIIDLSVPQGNSVSEVVLTNIEWHKEINYQEITQTVFDFEVSEIQYIPVKDLGVTEEVPVSRVSFLIDNLSAFNYRNVDFLIILISDGQTVAVNKAPLGEISSGQARQLEVNFFQQLPRISSVQIIPEVNILDPTSFLAI